MGFYFTRGLDVFFSRRQARGREALHKEEMEAVQNCILCLRDEDRRLKIANEASEQELQALRTAQVPKAACA